MIATLARTGLRALATLLVSFVVCFLLLHAMPGDPLDRLESPDVPPEQAERNRRALGLDRSLPEQFARTAASYARGELGVSSLRRRPVARVISEALPYTALLGAATLVLGYGLGLPLSLGLIALGDRSRRMLDQALLVLSIVPRFWLGLMLLLLLHDVAGWFPGSHAFSPGGDGTADLLSHLVLPALALGLPAASTVARYELTELRRTLDQPHVRTARARGTGRARLLSRHVLRPSLAPAITIFGLDLPVIASGAIVIEVVFAWPGLGRLTAQSVLESDYPLALGATLMSATLVVLGRTLAEGLARWADPRGRAGGG